MYSHHKNVYLHHNFFDMTTYNISIQPTSNEHIIKFATDTFLTQATSYEFNDAEEASISPLASELFKLPFVKAIYISQNFIALEKKPIVDWELVQDVVAEVIEKYLNSGQKVISTAKQKVPITIYAESTPNPEVMKFVANKRLVEEGKFEFQNAEEAKDAPIAKALFDFPFISQVFITSNYISISKYNVVSWEEITLELREFIKNYIENGNDIINANAIEQKKEEMKDITEDEYNSLDDTERKIVSLLKEFVEPAVNSDGGHIAFKSFDREKKTVQVVLHGACSGCPSSTYTLKGGIENILKKFMPNEVAHVEAVNG